MHGSGVHNGMYQHVKVCIRWRLNVVSTFWLHRNHAITLWDPGKGSLQLGSSPNEFSWGCKFVDCMFKVNNLHWTLCFKLDDVVASPTRNRRLISNMKYDSGWGLLFPFAKRSWWCHQMETFSALLAICAGNSPVPGEFPAQKPVTRSFYVFFHLHLNKQLSKQSSGWWFETLSRPLWRHCNDTTKTTLRSFSSVVKHPREHCWCWWFGMEVNNLHGMDFSQLRTSDTWIKW